METGTFIFPLRRPEHGALEFNYLVPFGVCIESAECISVETIHPKLLKDLVDRHQFVVLRGFSSLTKEAFLSHSRSMVAGHSQHIEWSFGPVMELRREAAAVNYLFSSEKVPFHWDGAFHEVPSFLLFHCLEAPSPLSGGETLFTSSVKLYMGLSEADIEAWQSAVLTYKTEKAAHYGGRFSTRLFVQHERTGEYTVRFAERVETELNPVSLTITGIPEAEVSRMVNDLTQKIYDPAYCLTHSWQSGDYVVADNRGLLHGRRAFKEDSPRHIRRIQLR